MGETDEIHDGQDWHSEEKASVVEDDTEVSDIKTAQR